MNHSILPARCPVTNQPARHENPVRFHKLIYPLTFLDRRVAGRLSYPLSPWTRTLMTAMRAGGALMLTGGLVAFALIFAAKKLLPAQLTIESAAYLGGALLIAGGIAITQANSLRIRGYRNGWFKVSGCSRRFLDSLPEYSFDDLR